MAQRRLSLMVHELAAELVSASIDRKKLGEDAYSLVVAEASDRFLSNCHEKDFDVANCSEMLSNDVRRALFARIAETLRAETTSWIKGRLPPRHREEFEVVWQEVCSTLDQNCTRYEWRDEPQFRGLLRRIALHKIFDLNRRKSAHMTRLDKPEHGSSSPGLSNLVPAGSTTPSRLARRDERNQRLMGAMSVLSDDERRVVTLRFLEMKSVRDTAEALGKSEGAIKMSCQRALSKMRSRLGSMTGGSS